MQLWICMYQIGSQNNNRRTKKCQIKKKNVNAQRRVAQAVLVREGVANGLP